MYQKNPHSPEMMMIRGGLCFIVTALLALTTAVCAANLTHTYTFDPPEIQIEAGYASIQMQDAPVWAPVGEPLLPTQALQLLLPPGEEAVSISVQTGEPVLIGSDLRIAPRQQPQPISQLDRSLATPPNEEIYDSDALYPAALSMNLRTDFLCGHSIATGLIFPVQYRPLSRELYYYPEMTVIIQTAPSVKAQTAFTTMLQRSERVQKRVTDLVQNPEASSAYGQEEPLDVDIWDLLVITTSSLMPYYDDYIYDKNLRNIATTSITTEEIYTSFSGIDNQDKIRNCITDFYQNHAIQYVLLAGDSQQIGLRKFYVEAGTESAQIPSDLYYGGLDGSWNDDGDNYWGELNEADFYAEVMVGRNCADNMVEAINCCTKTLMFETEPVVDELLTGLMVGEDMGWAAWGSEYKEQIRTGSNLYSYTTVGFPETFVVDTLYDNENYSWSAMNTLRPMLNEGPQLMNHLGHANWDYVMKFYRDQITDNNFTNNGTNHNFFIGYSQGCIAGNFEKNNPDCIIEEFTTIGHAAVAFVANSKYGWGVSSGTNGPSQRFDREFFDAIFGEDITAIGYTNDDSKTDNIALVGDGYYRWCYYELNLFGDPSLNIWTEQPGTFDPQLDDYILAGSTEITVDNITSFDIIATAGQNGEILGRGTSTFMGNIVIELDAPLAEPGIVDIAVTGEGMLPWYGEMEVIAPEITLTPENPPIVLPATGGSVNYNIMAANGTDYPITADIWCDLTLPDSTISDPIIGPVQNFTLAANWSGNRDRTVIVDGGSPGGTYTCNAYVGEYPDVAMAYDSFNFEKSGSDGSIWDGNWVSYGEDFEVTKVEPPLKSVESFDLVRVYPNPFNPTTVISYNLLTSGEVNLAVYDISGRQVATLVDGYRDAGLHEITFDGSGLAAGVYLYHLETAETTVNGKLVLLK